MGVVSLRAEHGPDSRFLRWENARPDTGTSANGRTTRRQGENLAVSYDHITASMESRSDSAVGLVQALSYKPWQRWIRWALAAYAARWRLRRAAMRWRCRRADALRSAGPRPVGALLEAPLACLPGAHLPRTSLRVYPARRQIVNPKLCLRHSFLNTYLNDFDLFLSTKSAVYQQRTLSASRCLWTRRATLTSPDSCMLHTAAAVVILGVI